MLLFQLNQLPCLHVLNQVGTLNYMSPEAILGGSTNILGGPPMKVGRPSDIWSLGCILYQMVYGRTPFADLPFIQKMHAICDANHQIKFPSCSSPDALDVISKCLDRDPKTRISMQVRYSLGSVWLLVLNLLWSVWLLSWTRWAVCGCYFEFAVECVAVSLVRVSAPLSHSWATAFGDALATSIPANTADALWCWSNAGSGAGNRTLTGLDMRAPSTLD